MDVSGGYAFGNNARHIQWRGCLSSTSSYVSKRVITLEMSCPWATNREKKKEEKTAKYGPLRWELKQNYQRYKVKQCNIIMDVLRGWSLDLEDELNELVGSKSKGVLHNMHKAVISGTLNISRTFKVAT